MGITSPRLTVGHSQPGGRESGWWQPKPPFTVDTLFDLPEGDLRYEVLGGQLVVNPTPTSAHNLAADRIRRFLIPHLPKQVDAVRAVAVRMLSGDGPVPDLVVTAGETHDIPLVIGPGAEMITVKLDPADLVGPRR